MLRISGIERRRVAIPWPIAAIIVVLGSQTAMFIGYSIAVVAGDRPAPADPWLFPLAPQLVALAYALVVVRLFGRPGSVGLRPPATDRWRWLPLVIAFIAPSILALVVGGIRSPAEWDAILPRNAIAAVREEIIYRGIVLALLLPLGQRRAVLISTLVFAAGHLFDVVGAFHPGNFGLAFLAFSSGLMLAAIRVRSGSIYPAIASHLIYNVCVVLVLPQGLFQVVSLAVVWPFAMIVLALWALRAPAPTPDATPP